MNFMRGFEFLYLNLFNLYLLIVIARFVLQIGRGDFYNPLSQFIFKATAPVLTPLRRIIPAFGRIDTASIVLFVVLVTIKLAFWVLFFKEGAFSSQFPLLLLLSSLGTITNFFLVTIFATVILSWISGPHHPVANVVRSMAEPLLGPVRRIIPPLGMLDLSAMIVLLFLFFIRTSFGLEFVP